MKFLLKNLNITLKIISWLQIAGGITGLGLMAYLMMHTEAVTGPVLLLLLIGVGLFIFSIYCGKTLLADEVKKKGIILSIVNQVLQILQWGLFGYQFIYSSGIELTIGIKDLALHFSASFITSNFSMSVNSGSDFFLKVNLVPVFLIIILEMIYLQIKEQKNLEPTPDLIIEHIPVDIE